MNPEEKSTDIELKTENETVAENEPEIKTEAETVANAPEEKKQDPFALFPLRYSKFMTFYEGVVFISFMGFLAAIGVAVYKNLLWGAIIAAAAFFFYVVFTSNELIERLGLSYKTSTGSLEITYCCQKYGEVFFIPSKLLWYDVERIGDNAFRSEKNKGLKEIYIPASIKSIGKDIISACPDLEAIRFEGSEEEWNAIEKETDFEGLDLTFLAAFPEIPKKQSNRKSKK